MDEDIVDTSLPDAGLETDAAAEDVTADLVAWLADSAVDSHAEDAPSAEIASADAIALCQFAGSYGCACASNSDCDSNICLDGLDGKLCTMACASSCPPDTQCIQPPGGGPFICDTVIASPCKPCSQLSDCQSPGASGAYCVPLAAGSFCSRDCKPVTDFWTDVVTDSCPSGYSCLDVTPIGASQPVKQCLPTSGTCACTAAWAAAGFATTCSLSNSIGTCPGVRQCGFDASSGQPALSACSGPVATTEKCDGIDNDCNGQTDDGAPCPAGTCVGGKCL